MQAICVTPDRKLALRDIPAPTRPAPGHVLIDMNASAINHGDKAFLHRPTIAGAPLAAVGHDVWGASGSGTVIASGDGVPARYLGRQVAVYRSLDRSPDTIGLWCERAQVPQASCLVLPEHVQARDYSGSLVNVMTAYAFLEEIAEAGHHGIIATAGNSATGRALASLARHRNLPVIHLVRNEAERDALEDVGVDHVIVTRDGFTETLAAQAERLGATAVFDGIGGELPGVIAPSLPDNATIYLYGLLGGTAPFSIQSALFMQKNLSVRRFSNFASSTVSDPAKRIAALQLLEAVIDDPMLATRVGKTFRLDQIDQAMAYESHNGSKAVLVA